MTKINLRRILKKRVVPATPREILEVCAYAFGVCFSGLALMFVIVIYLS